MIDVPAAVVRMIEATNAGDSAAFVEAFADDAYLEDWGRKYHGRDGVRSWDATDNIGKHAHFDAEGVRRDGDDWIVTLRVSGGGFNGTSDIRFGIIGDRIARMIIAP
jgi:ketosteroid isomerase-like protein